MPPLAPTAALAPLQQGGENLRAKIPGPSPGPGADHFRALLTRADPMANSGLAASTRSAASPLPGGAPLTPGEALHSFYTEAHTRSRALDGIIAEARAGRAFSSQELIGLQARIYRSTLVLETFSKGVESASGAARQLLETSL